MEKLSYFTGEWYERQRINQAIDELNVLDGTTEGLQQQIYRLFQLDRDQGREIARLQALVSALMTALVEQGVVDLDALSGRIEAAMRAVEQREAAEEARPRMVICCRCGNEVALQRTYVTGAGEVCDRCYITDEG